MVISRRWARGILAGPLVFVCAFAVMCGASVWLPAGPARLDNIAIPLVLFPGIWAILFFYCYLTNNLGRAYAVVLLLLCTHLALIAWQLGAQPGAGA